MLMPSQEHNTTQVNKVTYKQQRPHDCLRQNQWTNCNKKYPHKQGPISCPALESQCTYCQRCGHFTSVCFRKLHCKDWQWRTNAPHLTHKLKPVSDGWTALKITNRTQSTTVTWNMYSIQIKWKTFPVSMYDNPQAFSALADSGDTIHILSEAHFKCLKPTPPSLTQKNCNVWIWCQGNHSSSRSIQHCSGVYDKRLPSWHTMSPAN